MRRILLSLALLWPMLASAENLYTTPRSWRPTPYGFRTVPDESQPVVTAPLKVTGPLLEEDNRRNFALQSIDLTTSPWATQGSCTITANQGTGDYTDLDLVSCSGVLNTRYQNVVLPAATNGPVTACVTVAATADTAAVSFGLSTASMGSSSTQSCSRSDGGSCTTAHLGSFNIPYVNATVGTVPVQLCMTVSYTGTSAAGWVVSLHDGAFTTTGPAALFGRVTVVPGEYTALPNVTTTTTAALGAVSHVWFDGRHNLALQSGTPSSGTSAVSPWSLVTATVATVAGAPEGGTWGEVTTTATNQYLTQAVTVPSGTSFSVSYYVQRTAGGQHTSLIRCGAGNASGSCTRSDGTACTLTPSTSDLFVGDAAGLTLGTDPVRVTVSLTCSSATTTVTWRGYGAEINVAGTTRYTALNVSTAPSEYVPTTTAARTSVPLDTVSNTWTENGSVPATQATVSPFVPGKAGAGPYSAANNYQGSTSLMEWGSSEWSVTVVFKPTDTVAQQMLIAKGSTTIGWLFDVLNGGTLRCYVYDGVLRAATTVNAVTVGSINVATCGRSGGLLYARLNGGAAVSAAVGTMTAASAEPVRVGRYSPAGLEASVTTIYEILASTTAYSDALHLARYQRVFGMLTQQGQAISVTRATDQTYTANGYVWSTPNDTLSTGTNGAEVWKAATNSVVSPSAACVGTTTTAPWVQTLTTCSADAQTAPNGDGMDEYVSTNNAGGVYQPVTTASTSSFVGSAWIAKPSGSKTTLSVYDTGCAMSGCVCGASDGSACVASANTADGCKAVFSAVTATPIRGWVAGTCSAPRTTMRIYVYPGEYGVSTGTTRFGMAQAEPGLYPTPYTTATRNAGVVTTPLPDLGNKWCISVTAKPGRSWSAANLAVASIGNAIYTATGGRSILTLTTGRVAYYAESGSPVVQSAVHSFTDGSSHRITVCEKPGVQSICLDGGAPVSSAVSGLTTPTTTFSLGNYYGGGIQFDGALSNLKICRGATKCGDCR